VASLHEAVRDPHFAARGLFRHLVAGPSGAIMPALPVPIAAQFRAAGASVKSAPEMSRAEADRVGVKSPPPA
jgi:hypothetical protein